MTELSMTKIINRKAYFSELWDRMDTDKDLRDLEEFKLKDEDGNELTGVENVTMNDPLNMADRVKSVLAATTLQAKVTTRQLKNQDERDKKTTKIEQFLADLWVACDEYFDNTPDFPGVQNFFSEQVSVRGWLGARLELIPDKESVMIPHFNPYDMRYLTWQPGPDSMLWTAYQMSRDREVLMQQYPKKAELLSEGDNEVYDCYTATQEKVFANNMEMLSRTHASPGIIPVVIKACAAGRFFEDGKDGFHYRGESIFAPNRELYPKQNQTQSIIQTRNKLALAPPQALKSASGKKLPKENIYKAGRVLALSKDDELKGIDGIDITKSVQVANATLDAALQRGGFTHIDYGNLNFPLSGAALAILAGYGDQIFLPRLNTMAHFYRALARLAVRQARLAKKPFMFGQEGNRNEYKPADFEGEYAISFTFQSSLPEQQVAKYAMAIQAGELVSKDFKRRNILELDNPSGEEDQSNTEEIEQLIPELKMMRVAKSLLNNGYESEAKVVAAYIGATLESIENGTFIPGQDKRNTGQSDPYKSQQAIARKNQVDSMVSSVGRQAAVSQNRNPNRPKPGDFEGE